MIYSLYPHVNVLILSYSHVLYVCIPRLTCLTPPPRYVPNWAAGGSKNTVAEPAVAGRVLLDLYRRFGDKWLVQLLLDDLLDWSEWQWTHRRTVGTVGTAAGEPGFLTIGNDYATCSADSGNCPGGGESGLGASRMHQLILILHCRLVCVVGRVYNAMERASHLSHSILTVKTTQCVLRSSPPTLPRSLARHLPPPLAPLAPLPLPPYFSSDQSPKWDCPGAAGDGSGGNCSVYQNRTTLRGPNTAHILPLADTQSTALFVHDALALAELALVLGDDDVC